MYSSLHKVDIGIDEDGARIAVQTDHRQPAEIDEAPELSVIFAVTRVINPLRAGGFDRVRYTLLNRPPPWFHELLRLAGAEIETMGPDNELQVEASLAPEAQSVDQRVAMALRSLGARIFNERGLPLTEQGLLQLQAEYAERAEASGGREEDEIGWWTAVVELGAAVGELLLTRYGGRWARDADFASLIPWMIGRGSAYTNVFSKVERFFEHGEVETPVHLLRIHQDQAMEDGPVMFNLRPGDWFGRERAWGRALLPGADDAPTQPFVTLVRDMPNTTRTLGQMAEEEAADLCEQAERNLAALSVEVSEIDANGVRILITHGDYYAAEKLLDRRHMAALHEQLASGLLVSSVPAKGMLFTAALDDPEVTALFLAITRGRFERAPQNERLSPEVFLISGGEVVGVARPAPDDEP